MNGELNFANLYNKQRWLRAVNTPKPRPLNAVGVMEGRDLRKPDGKDDRGKAPETPKPDVPAPGSGIAPEPITRTKGQPDTVLIIDNAPVVISGLADKQVDSLRKVARAQEKAKAKAEEEDAE